MSHDDPRSTHDETPTASEREAYRTLPRERTPPPALEERTVAALRARGFLGGARRRPRAARWAVAAAAGLALFLAGTIYGRSTASPVAGGDPDRPVMGAPGGPTGDAVARVRTAGTAYVSAVEALARGADPADPLAWDAGRRAALETFRAAAGGVVTLAPDDPLVTGVLQGLERSERPAEEPGEEQRSVVWF